MKLKNHDTKFNVFYDKEEDCLATSTNDLDKTEPQRYQPIEAKTQDGALEKHMPVVKIEGEKAKIQIGSILHPMTPQHYIKSVVVITNEECYHHNFEPGEEPVSELKLGCGEKIFAILSYCNLHGVWMKELEDYKIEQGKSYEA